MKHTPGPWRIQETIPETGGGGRCGRAPEGHDTITSAFADARVLTIRSTTEHMRNVYGDSSGGHIADLPISFDGREQAVTNARLVTAAPEMRDALSWAHSQLTRSGWVCEGAQGCEICIACHKADGR